MAPIKRLQGGSLTMPPVVPVALSPVFNPAGSDVSGFLLLDMDGSQTFLDLGNGDLLALEPKS